MFELPKTFPHHKMYEAAESRLTLVAHKKQYELVRSGFGDICFESLTFRYGSQLFHVGFADKHGDVCHPKADKDTVIQLANFTGGHACIMRMRIDKTAQSASVLDDGWGLRDALSGDFINPDELPEKPSEINEFEMYDLASRIAVDELNARGFIAELRFRWSGHPYFTVTVEGKEVWVDASCGEAITKQSEEYLDSNRSDDSYYVAINFSRPLVRGMEAKYSFLMIPEISL